MLIVANLNKYFQEKQYHKEATEAIMHEFKRDYVAGRHSEGAKIFLGIYDGGGCNMDAAYKRLNQLLSDPEVGTVIDAMRALGLPEEQVLKYERASGSIQKRLDYLEKRGT